MIGGPVQAVAELLARAFYVALELIVVLVR
jgi:hypothetical protein